MGQAPYKTGPSVFLCHAGEDKDRFVEPLYKALVANGLKPDDIFYDKFSIQAGHDIKKSIESALANPNLQLVVTVLSRNLLCEHKYWPKREFELAQRYGLPIFPVWLGHDFGDFDTLVRKYSPTLKGIRALSVTCDSQTGIVEDKIIQDVADNIIKELPKTTKRSNVNAGFGVLALVAAIVVVIAVISQFITGCPIPNRPENGHVRFETRTHGSLATYTCTAGYELAGLHMRECVNGQWTGSQPICEKTAVLCPPVEGPANGAVQAADRQTGDRARFTCAPGYEMKGTQSILCQDGVWDGHKPTCEPKEGDIRLDSTDSYNQGQKDSGVYSIQPRDSDDVFRAWCEFEDGGAWTVIQRRQDGSVDFFRNWQEYKDGFGDVAGEYWLGNNNIYRLTNQAKYKLRIDLEDFNGRTFFAEYSHFRVENEADDYRLRLGNHSGNIGDGMTKLDRDQPFTTKDHGAKQGSHCASVQKTGWWFGKVCLNWANLNGMYKDSGEYTGEQNGIFWFPLRLIGYSKQHSLKKVTMKLRRLAEPLETEPTTTPAPEECKHLCNDTKLYEDCDAVKRSGERGSGVFWIRPRNTVEPFPVFCDLQDGDAAWTVIQQRNHTVGENFTRGWEDYKNGFGVIPREYWLGNDKIHKLTKDGDFRVKIQVQAFNGLVGSYQYDNFRVAGEDENYRLTLSGFTGRAGSCMERAGADLNGMAFSTMDRDNDKASYSCAERLKGGWWYKRCSLLILNGIIKKYSGHEEYREVTGRGEGLYNVCLQQGPPVSLGWVTIKIQARQRPDVYRDCTHARSDGKAASGVYHIQPRGSN